MELASSLQKGQIPVGCQLCEGGSKIQWKCCNCHLLMCTKCKEKVHSKFKNGNNHRMIDIKEVGQHNTGETITFSDINCLQHADQPNCLFCKTCQELVCPKCITKTHNGHNLVDEEEYRNKRDNIREVKSRIEKNLNNLTKMKHSISKIMKSEYSKYDKSKKDILAQKKIVEKLVEELLNELDDKWKNVHKDLEGKQTEVDNIEKKLHKQNTTVDKIMKSKDFMQFFNETDKLQRLLDHDVIQINNTYSSIKFVPGEVTRDNIGTLKTEDTLVEQETKTEFKVIRHLASDLKNIHSVETCSDGSLWICDSKSKLLQHIQTKGNDIQELPILNTDVLGMTAMSAHKLLICSGGESTLKEISSTGKIKDSQYCVAPLLPTAVHVTSDKNVIIGAMTPGELFPSTGRRVVIMMDQKGNNLAENELDSHKKPLYTFPYRITSTREGNICVIDRLDLDRGRVVVLSPTGDVINTYSGHCVINSKIPFTPRDIITTALNNIVVVDIYMHTIHILDSAGHFITHYNTKEIGISDPYSLAISTTGNLFIGCSGSRITFKSKLYEVEFSGF